jgi:uncharacterized protein (TIGR02217 family)
VGFHETRFPITISYGSRGGPAFASAVTEMDSGQVEVVQRWDGAGRRKYNASLGIRNLDDVADALEFFIARQGATHAFRWKDWADFTTAADHRSAPTFNDVQIGTGDASEVDFQLVKKYTSGGVTRTRNLQKPVAGTAVVAFDGVEQTSGWTVDTTTGIVTFSSAPGSAVVVSAGCEFDVPARFDEGIDADGLQVSQSFFEAESIPDVPITEEVDPTAIQDEYFYGGGTTLTVAAAATQSLSLLTARAWAVTASGAGATVQLPTASGLPSGGRFFIIHNAGSNAFDVDDFADALVGTLAAGETGDLFLVGSTWYMSK